MSLRVRFRGGTSAGNVLDFTDDVEWIRFGREPERCDVVFPAGETRVSREHFALRRVLGRYLLVTNRESPVFVNGEPGHDDQVLPATAEIQAGKRGPVLVVEVNEASAQPRTRGPKVAQPGAHTRLERVAAALRQNRLATGLALALVAAVGVAVWFGYQVTQNRLDRDSQLILDSFRKAEQFRKENLEKVDAARRAFRDVFERARGAVYLILDRQQDGSERLASPFGTAWHVPGDEGYLATAAHVAARFHGSGSLIARSSADSPVDVEIVDVHLHPGYAAFINGNRLTAQLNANVGRFFDRVAACDVALLRVRPEDRVKLGKPLVVAPREDLESLAAGDPLCFVGYPMEGFVQRGVDAERPEPKLQIGHVTSLTDDFHRATDARHAQLVNVSMVATGGASGSPVLDDKGRVVALLCAINPWQADAASPRVPVGGVSYAQRADLLLELLEGHAEADQQERTRRWNEELDRRFRRDEEAVFPLLCEQVTRKLENAGIRAPTLTPVGADHEHGQLSDATPEVEFSAIAPQNGIYVVIAVAQGPIDVDAVVVVDGSHKANDRETGTWATVRIDAGKDQRIVARISTFDPIPRPTPVRVKVYRVAES